MFKKLKDKLAEEVKASPQRVTQLAKAVVQGSNTTEDNMFSIDEDTAVNSFNSTPTPNYRNRRDSNSSYASDVSFLPSYESPGNTYHLQSDLDFSASEVEDASSNQTDRAQLATAYKSAVAKYNKYRGRYSDLANHYRTLERENAKTKSVLVETQDKALRRVAELKEQCSLEQSAKAHIEQVLREDLNEKQILIDTLNTKVKLLQSSDFSGAPANATEIETLRLQTQQLESEVQKLQEKHLKNVQDVRDSLKSKIIDLESKMQESRQELELKLVQRDEEIIQLQSTLAEQKAKDINADDMQKKLASVETENQLLVEKLKDAEKIGKKCNDLIAEVKAAKIIQTQTEDKFKHLDSSFKTKESTLHDVKLQFQELKDENARLLEQMTSESAQVIAKHQTEKELLQKRLTALEEQLNANDIQQQDNEVFVAALEEFINQINDCKPITNLNKNELLHELKLILESKTMLVDKSNRMCGKLSAEIKQLQEEQSSEDIINERNTLLQQIQHLQTTINTISNEKEEITIHLKKLQTSQDDLQNEKMELSENITKLKKTFQEKQLAFLNHFDERNKLNEDLDALQRSFDETKHDLTSITEERSKLNDEITKLRKQLDDYQSVIAKEQTEKQQLDEEIKQLHVSFNNLKSELSNVIEEKTRLQEDAKRLTNLAADNADVFEEQRKLNDDIQILNKLLETTQNSLAGVQDERNKLKEDLNMLQDSYGIQQKELTIANEDRNRLAIGLNKLQDVVDNKLPALQNFAKFQEKFNKTKLLLIETQKENEMKRDEIHNLLAVSEEKQTALATEKDEVLVEMSKLREIYENVKMQNSSMNMEKEKLHQDIAKLKLQLEESESSLINEEKERSTLKEEIQQIESLYEDIKSKLIEVSNERNTLLEEKADFSVTAEEIKQLQQELGESREDLTNNRRKNNENVDQLKATIEKLNTEIKYIESESLTSKSHISKLELQNQQLLVELQVANANVDVGKNQIESLEVFKAKCETHDSDKHKLSSEVQEIRQVNETQIAALRQENERNASKHDEAMRKIQNLQYELEKLTDERESNVQYYQDEIIKLRCKNEKLESKLDETLVTLNHCTELSSASTEMQYLRNILYNYMIGKESIVLARVIAAVCKFDHNQTDAVLQKEQQKQTLLGHLGLL